MGTKQQNPSQDPNQQQSQPRPQDDPNRQQQDPNRPDRNQQPQEALEPGQQPPTPQI